MIGTPFNGLSEWWFYCVTMIGTPFNGLPEWWFYCVTMIGTPVNGQNGGSIVSQ